MHTYTIHNVLHNWWCLTICVREQFIVCYSYNSRAAADAGIDLTNKTAAEVALLNIVHNAVAPNIEDVMQGYRVYLNEEIPDTQSKNNAK